jgi:hypothetical protein
MRLRRARSATTSGRGAAGAMSSTRRKAVRRCEVSKAGSAPDITNAKGDSAVATRLHDVPKLRTHPLWYVPAVVGRWRSGCSP